ncbi:MAG: GNAT family N-acetyltransferase [Bacteroidota bacterium]
MDIYALSRKEFHITTDVNQLQFDRIHAYLSRSYWCPGISLSMVKRAATHSLPFGLYKRKSQIGYARVVSDFTRIAYLADVYIEEAEKGKGLGKWLVESILSHPELLEVGRWMLLTRDAHGLYEKFDFSALLMPEMVMERVIDKM